MFVIRPVEEADLPAALGLAFDSLERPELVIDPSKVQRIATQCMKDGYYWMAEYDGKLAAAVAALVHPMTFYFGNQASVVQFRSIKVGAGWKLLRHFVAWCENRADIRRYSFTLHPDADPRIGKLLHRLGLDDSAPFYAKVKT